MLYVCSTRMVCVCVCVMCDIHTWFRFTDSVCLPIVVWLSWLNVNQFRFSFTVQIVALCFCICVAAVYMTCDDDDDDVFHISHHHNVRRTNISHYYLHFTHTAHTTLICKTYNSAERVSAALQKNAAFIIVQPHTHTQTWTYDKHCDDTMHLMMRILNHFLLLYVTYMIGEYLYTISAYKHKAT